MAEEKGGGTLSGLTEAQAKEFHGLFITGFIGFTLVAVVAHILAWMWRPWGGAGAATGLLEHGHTVITSMFS